MKTLFQFSLVLVVLLCACDQKHKDKNTSKPKEFAYLIGDWERTNEEDGKETYEHWRVDSGKNLHGLGYTLQEGDTVFKEKLRIIYKDSTWILRVTGVQETPVDFKVTSKDNHSFIAENPSNEFPTKITYSYFDDVLTAQVSSEEMEASFIFWRVEED